LVNGTKKDFQQDLYSFGWEIDKALYENMNVSLGISYDQSETPKTGGNEPQKDLSEWAGNVAMEWKIQPNFIISATVGKRTRPPTLRESYDTSLGKFLLNPMLREETATLSDIAFEWFPENYPIKLSLTPWTTKIDDALSRRIVFVDSLTLDQRYNLKGSKGRGLDFFVDWDPSEIMHFEIGASWQTFKAEKNDNNEIPEILRRPKYQLSFVMDYILRNNISSRLLIQRIGKALDEDITGEIATLEASTEIDLKLFYQRDRNWTFYSEINNLTNAVVLPQLGLPSRGRMVIFGVKYSMQ
jgi:outer membrane receptor protein involved in Fe transport